MLDYPNSETVVFIDKAEFGKFAENELKPLVEKLPTAVKISQIEDGEISFEGLASEGKEIDIEKLYAEISEAINGDNLEIQIPWKKLPAVVDVDINLEEMGIVELIGEAKTDYTGSPTSRLHNIGVAAKKLNGYIIPPDEKFSFIGGLGPVTKNAGYINGMVIVKGEIEPEIGGGVCQVSTTIFRSALKAGLPITQQTPHSLKIEYYYPPGLDATIYPGQHDLQFVNNTGNPILMQTFVKDATLQINFYGKSDGRKTQLAGPFYPNGNPIKDIAKAGLKMYWMREITQPNSEEVVEEKYAASYKIAPAH
jgi:vancomycin resistance protein YoaR